MKAKLQINVISYFMLKNVLKSYKCRQSLVYFGNKSRRAWKSLKLHTNILKLIHLKELTKYLRDFQIKFLRSEK